jgi:hypothetical protein
LPSFFISDKGYESDVCGFSKSWAKDPRQRNNEMNRIFKEFMENDYQRRFDVVIEIVVAALVGSIKKHAELVKIAKKKRQYKEDMQQIRFFNVAAFHPKSKARQLEKQLKKQSL